MGTDDSILELGCHVATRGTSPTVREGSGRKLRGDLQVHQGAIRTDWDQNIPFRVPRRELLRSGRRKDHARVIALIEAKKVNMNSLRDIIQRHKLADKWKAFARQFDLEE